MKKSKYAVGVVGATGLVGGSFIALMEKRGFPVSELRAFASPKSQVKRLYAYGGYLPVSTPTDGCFDGLDFVFFAAGKDVSLSLAEKAERAGATVIDNSSAFRYGDDIPLVVPEINFADINLDARRIIANPNCSTIQAVIPLSVLERNYGIERIIYTTYQAVSGSGRKGIADLRLTRNGFSPRYYPAPTAETCIPQIGEILPDGYTEEERKMSAETRKILKTDAAVSATCVRVPVENCHAVSVEAVLKTPFDLNSVRKELSATESVVTTDVPYAAQANGTGKVFVGRLRKSAAAENGIAFITYADNLLRGAAYNAVVIAEKIAAEYK